MSNMDHSVSLHAGDFKFHFSDLTANSMTTEDARPASVQSFPSNNLWLPAGGRGSARVPPSRLGLRRPPAGPLGLA